MATKHLITSRKDWTGSTLKKDDWIFYVSARKTKTFAELESEGYELAAIFINKYWIWKRKEK